MDWEETLLSAWWGLGGKVPPVDSHSQNSPSLPSQGGPWEKQKVQSGVMGSSAPFTRPELGIHIPFACCFNEGENEWGAMCEGSLGWSKCGGLLGRLDCIGLHFFGCQLIWIQKWHGTAGTGSLFTTHWEIIPNSQSKPWGWGLARYAGGGSRREQGSERIPSQEETIYAF